MSDSDYILPRKVNDPNTGDLKTSKDFQRLQEQQFIYDTLKRKREIEAEKNRRERIKKQKTVI